MNRCDNVARFLQGRMYASKPGTDSDIYDWMRRDKREKNLNRKGNAKGKDNQSKRGAVSSASCHCLLLLVGRMHHGNKP
jgi:hypothetical protein